MPQLSSKLTLSPEKRGQSRGLEASVTAHPCMFSRRLRAPVPWGELLLENAANRCANEPRLVAVRRDYSLSWPCLLSIGTEPQKKAAKAGRSSAFGDRASRPHGLLASLNASISPTQTKVYVIPGNAMHRKKN
jgi:hypothetical protein